MDQFCKICEKPVQEANSPLCEECIDDMQSLRAQRASETSPTQNTSSNNNNTVNAHSSTVNLRSAARDYIEHPPPPPPILHRPSIDLSPSERVELRVSISDHLRFSWIITLVGFVGSLCGILGVTVFDINKVLPEGMGF